MLEELADGSVKHSGPGACGRVWRAGGGMSAMERASRCPDLNDEMLSQVVAGQSKATKDLAALASNYEAALAASVADRAALNRAVAALTAQVGEVTQRAADLAARAAALEARQPAFGYQATTALALLATRDYTLTLSRPMPSATYQRAVLVDPAVAGKLGATVTAQTATTVTVRTTALVAVGAGGFTVLAWT